MNGDGGDREESLSKLVNTHSQYVPLHCFTRAHAIKPILFVKSTQNWCTFLCSMVLKTHMQLYGEAASQG